MLSSSRKWNKPQSRWKESSRLRGSNSFPKGCLPLPGAARDACGLCTRQIWWLPGGTSIEIKPPQVKAAGILWISDGFYKKAGWAGHDKQASKQHGLLHWLHPQVPALLGFLSWCLLNNGQWCGDISKINPFSPTCWSWCFLSSVITLRHTVKSKFEPNVLDPKALHWTHICTGVKKLSATSVPESPTVSLQKHRCTPFLCPRAESNQTFLTCTIKLPDILTKHQGRTCS